MMADSLRIRAGEAVDLETGQTRREAIPEQAAKPFAALCFAFLAMLALLLPMAGGSARADLALARRSGETRLDTSSFRLHPLILPSADQLRKAQNPKLQPKKWAFGGSDAALAPPALEIVSAYGANSTASFVNTSGVDPRPRKTHPPRAPPSFPFTL